MAIPIISVKMCCIAITYDHILETFVAIVWFFHTRIDNHSNLTENGSPKSTVTVLESHKIPLCIVALRFVYTGITGIVIKCPQICGHIM